MANQFLINEQPIVQCHLMLPKIGAWMANDVLVDTDTEFNIGDSVTMNFLDQTFKGTILDTGVYRGFQQCTIIGGSGRKLSSEIVLKHQSQSILLLEFPLG